MELFPLVDLPWLLTWPRPAYLGALSWWLGVQPPGVPLGEGPG